MTRWKASGIHFSISLMIGIFAFCVLYFVYYPQPYFEPAGASKLVMILLGVDIVLGPLLTLSVFKAGKRGMRFDLAVIGAVQAAALIYGLSIMWRARPIFIVAVIDRVELIYAGDIDQVDFNASTDPDFSSPPLFGPKLVFTRRASPGDEQLELMDAATRGKDVQHYPKFFVQPSEQRLSDLLHSAKRFEDLPPATQSKLASTVQNYQTRQYLPFQGRSDAYVIVVDPETKKFAQSVLGTGWY